MSEPKQKPGRSKQDYGTPPEFLAAVTVYLGIVDFDWDLAADADNAVVPSFIAKEIDALGPDPWPNCGGWNWLNPPFGKIGPWVQRAHQEWITNDTRTAMLIPASVGAAWWREHVHGKAGVLFIGPRLTFVGCADPFPKDCALLLYGAAAGYLPWTWKQGKAVGAVATPPEQATPDPSRKRTQPSSPDEATA